MNGSDITAYITRFSDLALRCPGMVTLESKKVERFIWGLTPPTQENVLAANPLTFDIAKQLEQESIEHGDCQEPVPSAHEPPKEGGGKKKFWNKRKVESSQEPSKKQQTVAVHAATISHVVPTAQAPSNRY